MNTPAKPKSANEAAAPLRVGFVALNDCAPFAVARELGFFEKYGLKVELRRELGWATVRDKIIHGELDGAHALAGMPIAAALGLGSIKCECVAGMIVSLHGNAITLATQLRDKGVRDAATLRELIRKERQNKSFTFGVVSAFSSHNFLLRQWLASGGIDPIDVRIVVVPPAQMVANLESGNLDGYCVGEPWNFLAAQRGIGWCPAASAELAPLHPEKVLMTRRDFAEKRRAEHLALIASLIEACAFCDHAENIGEVARILALPRYLNLPADAVARSLTGSLKPAGGGSAAPIFHRNGANEPSQEKIAWIARSVLQNGSLPERVTFPMSAAERIFSPGIYSEAGKLIQDPNIREVQPPYA